MTEQEAVQIILDFLENDYDQNKNAFIVSSKFKDAEKILGKVKVQELFNDYFHDLEYSQRKEPNTWDDE